MKKRWAVYTATCTQLIDSSPAGYKHQHVHRVLHQSDGGRSGADQPQRTARTRVWSKPHQGPNRFTKEGGKLAISESCDFFKREEVETEGAL